MSSQWGQSSFSVSFQYWRRPCTSISTPVDAFRLVFGQVKRRRATAISCALSKSKWAPAAKSQRHSDRDKKDEGACDRHAERTPASERIERAPKSIWVDAGARLCSACRRDPHGLARSRWSMKVDRD